MLCFLLGMLVVGLLENVVKEFSAPVHATLILVQLSTFCKDNGVVVAT